MSDTQLVSACQTQKFPDCSVSDSQVVQGAEGWTNADDVSARTFEIPDSQLLRGVQVPDDEEFGDFDMDDSVTDTCLVRNVEQVGPPAFSPFNRSLLHGYQCIPSIRCICNMLSYFVGA